MNTGHIRKSGCEGVEDKVLICLCKGDAQFRNKQRKRITGDNYMNISRFTWNMAMKTVYVACAYTVHTHTHVCTQ